MRRLPLAFPLMLVLAGCGESNRDQESSQPTNDVMAEAVTDNQSAVTSVMRPSVAAETNVVEPAPLQPARTIVQFEAGDALDPEARAALDALLTQPAMEAGGPILISGHSDSRGHDGDNLVASQKRAEAVRDYLAAKGVPEDRMRIVALGEARPLVPNANPDGSDNPEGRARNRRVEVEVSTS